MSFEENFFIIFKINLSNFLKPATAIHNLTALALAMCTNKTNLSALDDFLLLSFIKINESDSKF